jgi:hypothetical protein
MSGNRQHLMHKWTGCREQQFAIVGEREVEGAFHFGTFSQTIAGDKSAREVWTDHNQIPLLREGRPGFQSRAPDTVHGCTRHGDTHRGYEAGSASQALIQGRGCRGEVAHMLERRQEYIWLSEPLCLLLEHAGHGQEQAFSLPAHRASLTYY